MNVAVQSAYVLSPGILIRLPLNGTSITPNVNAGIAPDLHRIGTLSRSTPSIVSSTSISIRNKFAFDPPFSFSLKVSILKKSFAIFYSLFECKVVVRPSYSKLFESICRVIRQINSTDILWPTVF